MCYKFEKRYEKNYKCLDKEKRPIEETFEVWLTYIKLKIRGKKFMTAETNKQKPSLLGMISNPTEQFERIRERPIIWGAMGIIIILFIIGTSLGFIGVDFSEVLSESGLEVDEELESILKGIGIFSVFFGAIIGPIIGVLIASVIHLLVAKIAQTTVNFRQLFSMNTYIMIVTVLGVIVNGIFYAISSQGTDIPFTSLGYFIHLDGPSDAVVNSLEVFDIWKLILTAIGLEKVARFSKGLAWAIPIVIFLVGIIFGIMGSSIPV